MKVLEQLQQISELDGAVEFFVDNVDELQEKENGYIIELYYSNAIGIELEKNSINYRIYDPFGQITSQYRNANGMTNWSIGDPNEN